MDIKGATGVNRIDTQEHVCFVMHAGSTGVFGKLNLYFGQRKDRTCLENSAQERRESYRAGTIQMINLYSGSRKNLKVTLKNIWCRQGNY